MAASKAWDKRIRSLRLRKYREREGLFVAEGEKLIDQLCAFGLRPALHLCIQESNDKNILQIDAEALRRLSNLENPSSSLAVFPIPKFDNPSKSTKLDLYLEDLQDPGNLGTILRTASWFGIRHISCSHGTADAFQPKVVQASMGAVANVQLQKESLIDCTARWRDENRRVLAADMLGTELNALDADTEKWAVIVGNEGQGLSKEAREVADEIVSIGGTPHQRVESLNAAMAAGIIMAALH